LEKICTANFFQTTKQKIQSFSRYNRAMRKIIGLAALLLGVLFFLSRFAELQEVLNVIRRGSLIFIGLALLVEAVWILNLSAFYQSIFRVLGMNARRWHLIKLVTAANFLTVVAPSGGLSGIAIFIADAKRNGRSTARVTVAGALYVWFEYIGTLAVVTLGLGVLAQRNNLHWPEIAASLLLLAGAVGMSLLLYLGMKSAKALGKTLAWLARAVNYVLRPLLRRNYLQEERAHSFASEVAEGISALRGKPHWALKPLLFALMNKGILLVVLFLCFQAFNVDVTASTVVAGLAIAHLFLIISPTPAGIGIVEGILAVALSTMGVPRHDAAVVTLAYRGFSFWLPLLVGMIAFRMLTQAKPENAPEPVPYPLLGD
jgi:glycosyltransferase 2 family protein